MKPDLVSCIVKGIGELTLSDSRSSSFSSVSSVLTSSSDSIEDIEESEFELEEQESDSISTSSCDSTDIEYGALTLANQSRAPVSHIKTRFKPNLKDTAAKNVVTAEEIADNPGKYHVFLSKGDRLDYFQDHTSRRDFAKKAVEDTVAGTAKPYLSQAKEAILAKPTKERQRLLRSIRKNSALEVENIRLYVSPRGFCNSVTRMGNGLGNPWLSLSKSSGLSTRYAEAIKYDPDDPKLHPHYNYTPRGRTLFTAIKEGKLQKGWRIYWEDNQNGEFDGTVNNIRVSKKAKTIIKVSESSGNRRTTLTVDNKTGEITADDGVAFGNAKKHILTQRPQEKGRPKHRLIGVKTVFVFEANDFQEMSKVDVEDFRNRDEIKGKCAVERENHEVILPLEVPANNVAGRVLVISPNLSKKSEKVYGLTEFQRSRPRDEHGDLTKHFKETHIAPKIEQMEYKLALRHAQKTDPDAELLWVDKVGSFRRVKCNTL